MGLDMKRWVTSIILVLTVCTTVTLVLTLLATKTTLPPGTKFGLVFDAGSSHTSLFVYQWPADKENDTGVVSQTMACDVQGLCEGGKCTVYLGPHCCHPYPSLFSPSAPSSVCPWVSLCGPQPLSSFPAPPSIHSLPHLNSWHPHDSACRGWNL